MATTLDWVKSVRADIRGDCGKGWNLRGREVGGKMVMQIDRNDENGRSTLLTNIGWRKDNKRNILNAIVEIKDYMYHNGDSLKEAYKKFSNQSNYDYLFIFVNAKGFDFKTFDPTNINSSKL